MLLSNIKITSTLKAFPLMVFVLLSGCGSNSSSINNNGSIQITGANAAGEPINMKITPWTNDNIVLHAEGNDAPSSLELKTYSNTNQYAIMTLKFNLTDGSVSELIYVDAQQKNYLYCLFDACKNYKVTLDRLANKIILEVNEPNQILQQDNLQTDVLIKLRQGGSISVMGKIIADVDPNWSVIQINRFPKKEALTGNVTLNGTAHSVTAASDISSTLYASQYFTLDNNPAHIFSLRNNEDYSYTTSIALANNIDLGSLHTDTPLLISVIDGYQYVDGKDIPMYKPTQPTAVGTLDVHIKNPVASGLITTNTGKPFTPESYFLSVGNNSKLYAFTEKYTDSNTPTKSIWITVESNIVTGAGYTQSFWTTDTIPNECNSLSTATIPKCSGITLDADGLTFHFNQVKMSDNLILNGTLKHAGAN